MKKAKATSKFVPTIRGALKFLLCAIFRIEFTIEFETDNIVFNDSQTETTLKGD